MDPCILFFPEPLRFQIAKVESARKELSTGTSFSKFWPNLTVTDTKNQATFGEKNPLPILLFTYYSVTD